MGTDIKATIIGLLREIKDKKPLIHHITNYISANDSANIVLAIGASPIMAEYAGEVEDVVACASALVINIGMLNDVKLEAMLRAGKTANKLEVPVILDPVGAGVSSYRKEALKELLKEVGFSVIRGNIAEIKVLCGMDSALKGVDSDERHPDEGKAVAKLLAGSLNTVVAVTGKVDYISDGEKVASIENGHEILARITGAGCMATSLIAAYCGVTRDYFAAAVAGIATMGIAGEMGYEKLGTDEGSGSHKVYLMDAAYRFSGEDLLKRGKIYIHHAGS